MVFTSCLLLGWKSITKLFAATLYAKLPAGCSLLQRTSLPSANQCTKKSFGRLRLASDRDLIPIGLSCVCENGAQSKRCTAVPTFQHAARLNEPSEHLGTAEVMMGTVAHQDF